MTADPQENFNIASLPEYKEVFESNDDGVDEEDGDDSSRREDVLFLMLGKLTRRRWRIFLERIQYRRISGGDDDDQEFLKWGWISKVVEDQNLVKSMIIRRKFLKVVAELATRLREGWRAEIQSRWIGAAD